MADEHPLPETVQWEDFWADRGGIQPGEHVSVFGPTGTGKTYTLIWFGEDFPSHTVLVVTKGRDKIVNRLVKERGWVLATDVDDILTAAGTPGRLLRRTWGDRWEKKNRPPQRIVFKPTVPGGSVKGRAEYLQAAVEALIDRAYEYCAHAEGNQLFVGIDETMFAAMELDLSRPFVMLWNEGRSMELSLGAGMQRPSWIPKSSKSAPRYVVIFGTTEPDDLADFAKMIGVPPATLRVWLDQLDEHQHLLLETRGRGRRVYVSRVVIRKRKAEGNGNRRADKGVQGARADGRAAARR